MSYGQRKIYSEQREITAANVRDEVNTAYAVRCQNQSEIETLWNEFRGQSKILHKTKEIREEINHKIHEARAYEIAQFHKGYVFGEPIQNPRMATKRFLPISKSRNLPVRTAQILFS